MSGVQTVLGSLRPAVVALIGSAGASILMLGLFQTDIAHASLGELHWIELFVFVGALLIIRKYKVSAVSIILGSGVAGTLLYMASGKI